jgi:AcrR family transcriptional regulator
MDDLADELGMSKKTLYANFGSKMTLLDAVIHDKFQSVEADLAQITSGRFSDIASSMEDFLVCLLQHFQEIQPPFVRDVHRSAPDVFKSIQVRRRELIESHFGRILNQGQRKGLVRTDITTKLIIEILLGAIDAIINPQNLPELNLTPKEALSTILRIFLQGVMTERARAKR